MRNCRCIQFGLSLIPVWDSRTEQTEKMSPARVREVDLVWVWELTSWSIYISSERGFDHGNVESENKRMTERRRGVEQQTCREEALRIRAQHLWQARNLDRRVRYDIQDLLSALERRDTIGQLAS